MGSVELLDQISYVTGVVLAAVSGLLSFSRAKKRKDAPLFYYLLAGFYACVFLSNAYYWLTWFLLDYPYVISPGDLSWVGGIVFLIAAALDAMDKWTPEQKADAHKQRPFALIAPAVCIAFNIAYIQIYPQITANYLLYGIPTVILSYHTLLIFLTGRKSGVRDALRPYHLTILAWIATSLFYDLFSTLGANYGYAVHITVCSYLLTAITTAVYFAARNGEKA